MHFHSDTSKVDCFRLSYLSLIPHHLVSITHTSYLTKAYSASSWQFLVHFHPFHSSIRVKFAFKFDYFYQQKSRKRVPLSKFFRIFSCFFPKSENASEITLRSEQTIKKCTFIWTLPKLIVSVCRTSH